MQRRSTRLFTPCTLHRLSMTWSRGLLCMSLSRRSSPVLMISWILASTFLPMPLMCLTCAADSTSKLRPRRIFAALE